ncbi:MAG: MBL fold metallo-hydrolase, partial [Candidatus Latescibacteria bacterium]|nr:MBL fold metallo-hydrolase [Candidatus Latescibacterota bacterium]
VSTDKIDTVILTHLHHDHAGGCTVRDSNGGLSPTFPNAKHCVQKDEWEAAQNPIALNYRTYLSENFDPLMDAELVDLIDGDTELVAGVSVIKTGGHSHGHQAVRIDGEDVSALFPGDIAPTTKHLHPACVMAYDLFPLDVMRERDRVLSLAADEELCVIWEHDHRTPVSTVCSDEKGRFEIGAFAQD